MFTINSGRIVIRCCSSLQGPTPCPLNGAPRPPGGRWNTTAFISYRTAGSTSRPASRSPRSPNWWTTTLVNDSYLRCMILVSPWTHHIDHGGLGRGDMAHDYMFDSLKLLLSKLNKVLKLFREKWRENPAVQLKISCKRSNRPLMCTQWFLPRRRGRWALLYLKGAVFHPGLQQCPCHDWAPTHGCQKAHHQLERRG